MDAHSIHAYGDSKSPVDVRKLTRDDTDAQDLAILGHEQTMNRNFGLISILALAFCVLGTWAVFAQNLAAALSIGGPIDMLWGLLLVFFCNMCIAMSLGEMCSSMPTALGQAYWIFKLWETPWGRFVSYLTAWINTFGWWALTASQMAFLTELLLAMKVMFSPDWAGAGQGWTQFLVYIGITVLFTAFNAVACRNSKVLPYFNNFVGAGFVVLFIVIAMVVLIAVGVKNNLDFQPASFVFGAWINKTGWTDGVTFFIGLVQSAYGLTAFDAVIHMIEEIPDPRRNGPKAMYLSVACGAASGFIFLVCMLFSIQNLDSVLNSITGFPMIDIMTDAIGLVGSAVLTALFIFNGFGQGISLVTSSSRLTWGFARDGGLPFGDFFGHIDTTWHVPMRALWLQCAIVCLIGILYLFSTTVLNAILSVSTVALTISYAIPIVVLLAVGRDKLPTRTFSLGKFAPFANYVSIAFCVVTSIFFFFPDSPNPAAADMNWAIVVFAVMLAVAMIFWFSRGRVTYLHPITESTDIVS